MAQPTTIREKMSSTTARYSQLSPVQIAVISATHAGSGSYGAKLAVEQVGSNWLLMLAVSGARAMRARPRVQSLLAHEPGDPLAPATRSFSSASAA